MLEMPVAAQQRFPKPMGEGRQATVLWIERLRDSNQTEEEMNFGDEDELEFDHDTRA